jgi:hypothetical protein
MNQMWLWAVTMLDVDELVGARFRHPARITVPTRERIRGIS